MKAFLLAGGKGERLRPLTSRMPKCLVPIRGTPLLGIWLEAFERQGISDALVNVSQFPEQVEALVRARASRLPRVRVVRELVPVGSAGTVAANRSFVDGEESFWIVYSDNLTNADLAPMLAFHRGHSDVLTMALFRAPDPRSAGIVSLGPGGRVVSFREKPERPEGNLANAGIYLARQPLFDGIPAGEGIRDLGHHVLPALVGRMRGFEIQGFMADIGTPARLARAEAEWPGF
jgi:mannose-1-phosphate guanylyltransferase